MSDSKNFGTYVVNIATELKLEVEYWHWPAQPASYDGMTPGEPATIEIDTIWLVEKFTKSVIDVTELDGKLFDITDLETQIHNTL